MRYTAVIFDMDGTLLNTLGDLEDSVNHMLRKYGYPEKSEDEVRKALGNGAAYLMSRMVPGGKENPLFGQILEEYGPTTSLTARSGPVPMRRAGSSGKAEEERGKAGDCFQ